MLARQQAVTPGSIERPPWFLAMTTGADPDPATSRRAGCRVVHYDDDGEPDAYAHYDPKERWDGMRPSTPARGRRTSSAASPEAEREMWRYLVDVDLVERREVGRLAEQRAALGAAPTGAAARQEGRWDHIWARPLDVAGVPVGTVVLVVGAGRARGRRHVPGPRRAVRARCVARRGVVRARPTAESADVTLSTSRPWAPAGSAGPTCGWPRAGGGLWAIDEHRAGAVGRAGVRCCAGTRPRTARPTSRRRGCGGAPRAAEPIVRVSCSFDAAGADVRWTGDGERRTVAFVPFRCLLAVGLLVLAAASACSDDDDDAVPVTTTVDDAPRRPKRRRRARRVDFETEVKLAALELLEIRNDVFQYPDVDRVAEYIGEFCTCLERERQIVAGVRRQGPPLDRPGGRAARNPDRAIRRRGPSFTLIARQPAGRHRRSGLASEAVPESPLAPYFVYARQE